MTDHRYVETYAGGDFKSIYYKNSGTRANRAITRQREALRPHGWTRTLFTCFTSRFHSDKAPKQKARRSAAPRTDRGRATSSAAAPLRRSAAKRSQSSRRRTTTRRRRTGGKRIGRERVDGHGRARDRRSTSTCCVAAEALPNSRRRTRRCQTRGGERRRVDGARREALCDDATRREPGGKQGRSCAAARA